MRMGDVSVILDIVCQFSVSGSTLGSNVLMFVNGILSCGLHGHLCKLYSISPGAIQRTALYHPHSHLPSPSQTVTRLRQ